MIKSMTGYGKAEAVLPAGKEQGDGCEQQHDGMVSHVYSAGTCFWNTITYSSGLFTKRS